jgi:hypothetical protein
VPELINLAAIHLQIHPRLSTLDPTPANERVYASEVKAFQPRDRQVSKHSLRHTESGRVRRTQVSQCGVIRQEVSGDMMLLANATAGG